MVLALPTAEGSLGVAFLALLLSGTALYLQRPRPRMEAVAVKDLPHNTLAVTVRNSGNSTAKRPWFTVAIDGENVSSNIGVGFLGADEARYIVTTAAFPEDAPDNIRGVVGCRHHRNGNLLAWSFDGGRRRRFRRRLSFGDVFEKFHKEPPPGRTEAVIRDDPV